MCHYTHLTPFEREKILFFLAEGKSITEIAHLLKRSKETASQERQRRTSWQVRHIAPYREANTVVGKQGKTCLVTLVDRKSRYLLGGKAMSKTAAAVNLHTIHGSAGPMKTPMAFYGSSSRKARTSRIRQRITSNRSTMS